MWLTVDTRITALLGKPAVAPGDGRLVVGAVQSLPNVSILVRVPGFPEGQVHTRFVLTPNVGLTPNPLKSPLRPRLRPPVLCDNLVSGDQYAPEAGRSLERSVG